MVDSSTLRTFSFTPQSTPTGSGVPVLPSSGIGGDGGLGVPGQVDLRDDGDEPLRGVGDDLPDVVTGVEAAVRPSVVLPVPARADHALGAPRTDLGQQREAFDLKAPPLIVGQVQVQDVELVHGQQIDVSEQVMPGHEVPRHVDHAAPPAEPRPILDGLRRHDRCPIVDPSPPVGGGREQLPEGLRSIEHAGRSAPSIRTPSARTASRYSSAAMLVSSARTMGPSPAGRPSRPATPLNSGGAATAMSR